MGDDRELILKLRRQISKLQSREIGHKATIKGLERECLRLLEIAYPAPSSFANAIIIDDVHKPCDNLSSNKGVENGQINHETTQETT